MNKFNVQANLTVPGLVWWHSPQWWHVKNRVGEAEWKKCFDKSNKDEKPQMIGANKLRFNGEHRGFPRRQCTRNPKPLKPRRTKHIQLRGLWSSAVLPTGRRIRLLELHKQWSAQSANGLLNEPSLQFTGRRVYAQAFSLLFLIY